MKLLRVLFGPSLACLAVAACSSGNHPGFVGNTRQAIGAPTPGAFHGHVMPTVQATNAAKKNGATPETGSLQYYGGKVISSVSLWAIYWGNAGSYQAQLNPFLQTVSGQGFLGWLGEYDTTTQNIGGGTFAGSIVDANAPSGTTVDDSQIQTELVNLINAGQLPAPDDNTLYFFFFPQGINITLGGQGSSCSTFCGYHDTLVSGSVEAYYGVMPDPATCGSSCDNQSSNYFADLTSVTTHELHEAITDAEVGIAIANSADGGTYPTFPNAWTSASGEIGDLCAWQNATFQGYNVQLEWSDHSNACIAPNAGSGSGSSSGGSSSSSGSSSGGSSSSSGSSSGGSSSGSGSSSGGGGLCDHDDCTTGDPLSPSCDTCASNVCNYDPYCCQTAWDSICVGEVASYCTSPVCGGGGSSSGGGSGSSSGGSSSSGGGSGSSSGGGGTCDHDDCTTGDALTPSCDACTANVCATDSYCCTTAWDGICVSEVGLYCSSPVCSAAQMSRAHAAPSRR